MFYAVKHIDIIILLYNEHCLVLSVSDMKSIEIKRFANIMNTHIEQNLGSELLGHTVLNVWSCICILQCMPCIV